MRIRRLESIIWGTLSNVVHLEDGVRSGSGKKGQEGKAQMMNGLLDSVQSTFTNVISLYSLNSSLG